MTFLRNGHRYRNHRNRNLKRKKQVKAKVVKPVSFVVKGLGLKRFRDEQHNLSTKRASLP